MHNNQLSSEMENIIRNVSEYRVQELEEAYRDDAMRAMGYEEQDADFNLHFQKSVL